MNFRTFLCIIYGSCDIYDNGGNYRDDYKDDNRNSYKDHNRDKGTNDKNKDMNDHRNANNNTSMDENMHPHTTISSNLTPSIIPIITSSSHSSADHKPSISIESNPTSTPYSNLTDIPSTIEDTSSSTDTTDPFDPRSPSYIPTIIGIVIIVLIALLVSYSVLRKTVFKKRYNLSNQGYYSMGENELGRTSSFDSNTDIQSPTIAMTSSRSSIVRIDQLINIELGEDNISNYRNTSNLQDFTEPARRSSAFLDYPDDFYHAYTEPEITSENVEHETVQRPAATFNLRDSQN